MSEYLKDELLEKLSLSKNTEEDVVYSDGKHKVYKDGHYIRKRDDYEH